MFLFIEEFFVNYISGFFSILFLKFTVYYNKKVFFNIFLIIFILFCALKKQKYFYCEYVEKRREECLTSHYEYILKS